MSAAERQREYRKRLRRGLATYRIDVDDEVFSTLYYAGLLMPEAASNPDAVRSALTRMAIDWARRTNPFL